MRLSEISHPNQLHGLSISELEAIAQEIREKHLQTIAVWGTFGARTGGGGTDLGIVPNP